MAERRRLALAEPVRVNDGDQIIQFVNSRERRRFPNRAFGDFAIAHQDVGVVIQFVQSRGERHADADAEALAERTRRHVREREARRGMTFQFAGELPERRQFGNRQKTVFRPRGVKQRRGVAFRQNETVVVIVVRILRIVTHLPEKKRGDQIRRREARGRMSAARRRRRGDGMNSQLVGDAL
jgi:hypothetical protein